MDSEEKKIEKNDTNPELKKAVSDELTSYMNPNSSSSISKNKISPYSVFPEGVPRPQTPEERANTKTHSKPIIRTFKGDMEEAIQANHISSINIALAENKRMMERMRVSEKEKKTVKINYATFVISFLLIVGGVLAFAIPYFLANRQFDKYKDPEIVYTNALITPDVEEKINLDSIIIDRIAQILAERIDQSNVKLGYIKNIYITETVNETEINIDAQKFVSLMKFNLPPEIKRTLKPEYMFGMHTFNGNQRFLILKMGSFENAFAGLLKWEIDLWRDFKDLFSLSSVGLDTNNRGSVFGIENVSFQDAVYSNKDTRLVKNSSGDVLFLYSIIDKNTVVFTTSVDTLKEVINRNLKSKAVIQ